MKVAAVKKPGGPGNLIIEERPDPVAGPGEVLVRVKASSLNYHDFVVVMGGIPTDDGRIPMSDGAGEVVAVGDGVTRFKPGDHVLSLFFPDWLKGEIDALGFGGVPGDGADGFAAELVAMPETAFTRMPAGYSFTEAATLPCAALTAWRGMFVEGSVKPGDWVLTQGTGGVSVFALQFAKAAGARVISTSSSNEKLERMTALGADHVINTAGGFREHVKDLTGGRGADVIYDPVGGDIFDESVRCIAFDGRLLVIGFTSGRIANVATNMPLIKGFSVVGVRAGEYGRQFPDLGRENVNQIWDWARAGKTRPYVHATLPLEETLEGFRALRDRKVVGKLIIAP